jgi:hypothetical protein
MKVNFVGAALFMAGLNAQAGAFKCTVMGMNSFGQFTVLASKELDLTSKERQVIYQNEKMAYFVHVVPSGSINLVIQNRQTKQGQLVSAKTDDGIVIVDPGTQSIFRCYNTEKYPQPQ